MRDLPFHLAILNPRELRSLYEDIAYILDLGDYSQWCIGTNDLNTYCCTADHPVNCVGLEDPATVSPGVLLYEFVTETDWQVNTIYTYDTTHVPSTIIGYDETSTLTSTETSTGTDYKTITADQPTVVVTIYTTTTVASSDHSSSSPSITSTLGNESNGSGNQGSTSGEAANGGGLTSNVAGTTSGSFPSQPSMAYQLIPRNEFSIMLIIMFICMS